MKTYFKLTLTILIIASCTNAFSQQFYYSGKKKNILVEDTTTLVFKTKDKEMASLFTRLPLGLIQSFDTSKLKGVASLKLKQNTNRKELLSILKGLNAISYSWHSLQLSNTFIIPTGEILLQPKKGVALNTILSKTGINDNVQFKSTDKYGVVTLNIVNADRLFVTANTIYESGFVEWCHPNFWYPIKHTTNDSLYADQWYLKNTGQFSGTSGIDINIENAWSITTGSSSIKIAVIDDGVEDHEDMSGRVLSGYTPRNISTGLGLPTSSGRHGEACAGIIAASQNNVIGIAGIASNCKIVPVNIFYDNNETVSDIAGAINWAWDNGQADVLSNSWGYGQGTPIGFDGIVQAISNARTYGRSGKGSIVIFASGNDNANVSFPGNVDGVITVGAIDNNGSLLSYSNTGSSMDLVAPSGSTASLPFTLSNPYDGIRTTDRMGSSGFNSGNYTSFNGTSAACPQVSGVAALLLSVNSNLTESQVTDILQSTATDMGTTGFDNSFGYGRLNACAAVNKALATTLTIIGDAEVCTTSNAYTVSTLPSSYSVSWSITPSNIASVNSSTGVVTRTGDGWATLKATFSNGCFTDSLSKQIHIGTLEAPTQMYFNGTSYNASSYPCLPKLTEYEITIDPIYGASSYYWSIGGTGLIYVGGQGTNTINVIIGSSTGTSLTFAVQPENACGRGSGLTINGEVCGTGSEEAFRVSPNPATSNIQIQSIDKKTLIKEIRIVDKMSFVRKQLKYSVENTSISLYVGDLASDIYYIQIFDGKKWTTKAISKK